MEELGRGRAGGLACGGVCGDGEGEGGQGEGEQRREQHGCYFSGDKGD